MSLSRDGNARSLAILKAAASNEHIHVIECIFDQTPRSLLDIRSINTVLCDSAAGVGRLDILQWAWWNGWYMDASSSCARAAAGGHLDVL